MRAYLTMKQWYKRFGRKEIIDLDRDTHPYWDCEYCRKDYAKYLTAK